MEVTSGATADVIEEELLARLGGHPVLREIDALSEQRFVEMLLQRRFISLVFPVIYDMGIDALAEADGLKLVRQILREEYPDESGDEPSHREDLVADLITLGITRGQVLASRPTSVTASVLADTLDQMADATTDPTGVKVWTMLRFWGEVVVSVEYGEYWKRMKAAFATAGRESRFYYPHHSHDGSEPLACASVEKIDDPDATHSCRMGGCLKRLLDATGAEDRFAEVEARVLELRLRFYDQF